MFGVAEEETAVEIRISVYIMHCRPKLGMFLLNEEIAVS